MTDIQYWDDTLTEEIEAIQQLVDQIQSMGDTPEKTGLFERIEKRLRGAQGPKRSFKMEIRLVADVNQRKKYETRLQRLDQQMMTLQADCKALKQEHERGELFEGQGGPGGEATEEDGQKAGDKMMGEMHDIQNKTEDSLGNTKAMIAASKEVGMATLEELERQRDVLSNIETEIDRVDDNLARAEALMKQFGKRMASDKFIQCFAVLNCLLLLAVIIYFVTKEGGLPGSEEKIPTSPLDAATTSPGRRFLRYEYEY